MDEELGYTYRIEEGGVFIYFGYFGWDIFIRLFTRFVCILFISFYFHLLSQIGKGRLGIGKTF